MKKALMFVSFILVMATLLAACGAPQAAGETTAPAAQRKQLIIAVPSDVAILDSQQADTTLTPNYLISQPLLAFDLDLSKLVPDLAESWEVSADGLQITWHLPADAQFSNGDALDAQAIIDAWNRYITISPYSADLAAISAMEAVDAATLRVTYSEPPAYLWAVLATDYGAPWDAAEALRVGDEAFGRAPVAGGPFKLKEWVQDSYTLLERNDNYHTNLPFLANKGPALLDEVMIRVIPEDLTRASELEAGNVDIVLGLPTSEIARFQSNPDIEVIYAPTPSYGAIYFNFMRETWQDVNLRAAVAEALDRSQIVTALNGTVDEQYSFIAPAQLCFSADMEASIKAMHPYNVEHAKELLAAAGYEDSNGDGLVEKDGNPFEISLVISADDSIMPKAAVVIQAQLQAIGLKVNIEEYAGPQRNEVLSQGDYDLGMVGWSWPDPDILYYEVGSEGDNFSHYNNPDVEALLLEARAIMDLTARTAKYAEVQQILADEVVAVPLYSERQYNGVRKWVKGYTFHALYGGVFYLNNVTIEP